ncbi:porin [Hydrogenophaga pseudoflava]|uniref:Outer membrane porin protein 32 n=1 Tax=Hydrogenophaga pseudoflava TaxID=47421 RepID=A0A4P6X460_HYDPS|nr:porin [Hydrogenophaga pseudoflava]QBM29989.1 Outer membrane porin protein 32 precursor [Hydrogenophaga pseudoflava]
MKKTLIALAAVAATGVAFAQSSVTIYGKVEAGLQKMNGDSLKMTNIHGSRLGFRGAEDLGGGLQAKFQIEHRFSPDTGMDATYSPGGTNPATGVVTPASSTFWNGMSTVGLAGSFGEIRLGRYYSANFLGANNKPDPFGGDGAGALRGIGMQTTHVRTANIIHYSGSFSGVNVAVSTGLKEGAAKAHNSFAVGYANGPLDVGVGADKDAGSDVTNAYATYDLGVAKLAFGLGNKKTAAGVKTEGLLFGATIPAGPGKVLVGVAQAKNKTTDTTTNQKVGLGYYYPLSKRTALEFTYGRDSKAKTATGKNVGGADFTLHHNF